MKTDDLIAAIAADAGTPPRRLSPAFRAGLGLAVVCAGLSFWTMLGPRPDFAAVVGTVRFPLKFALTGMFALAAAALTIGLARPGADLRPARLLLAAAVVALVASVAGELAMTPASGWQARLVGRNSLLCVASVPALSILPLGAILIVMRRGAPESSAALGGAAGLLAGAIGATFYAAHCGDDSPLFIAVWYPLGVGLVAALGAVVGSRLFRW